MHWAISEVQSRGTWKAKDQVEEQIRSFWRGIKQGSGTAASPDQTRRYRLPMPIRFFYITYHSCTVRCKRNEEHRSMTRPNKPFHTGHRRTYYRSNCAIDDRMQPTTSDRISSRSQSKAERRRPGSLKRIFLCQVVGVASLAANTPLSAL